MSPPSPRALLAAGGLATVAVGGLALLLGAARMTQTRPDAPRSDPAQAAAHPGQWVRLPNGRRLNFRCSGAGAPTVIFEGGFAATSLAWEGIRHALSAEMRACAYDRAGYGFSDPGPMPRDGNAVAGDLDQGLKNAGISGPFILVGHSAGGLYVRLFADRRRSDVVGMVLVDPSIEFQDQRFAAVFGPGAGSLAGQRDRAERCRLAATRGLLPSTDRTLSVCVSPSRSDQPASVTAARSAEASRPSTWETQESELDTLWTATSEAVWEGRSSYGAMPLIVLTADGTYSGVPDRARIAVQTLWTELHREIASRSSRGREQSVDHSSHMMMFDRPDAIIKAVRDVARTARRGAPARP